MVSRVANIVPLTFNGVIIGKIVFDDDGADIKLSNKEARQFLDELARRKRIESLSLTIEPSPDHAERDITLGHLRVVKGR